MSGDGLHTTPEYGDGRTDHGTQTPDMVLVPAVQLDELLSEIRQLRKDLEYAVSQPLVSAAYLAWRSDCSEQTIMRRAEAWGIPKRDLNGDMKQDNTGPVRFSIHEWRVARRLHGRSVKNSIRHHDSIKKKGIAR